MNTKHAVLFSGILLLNAGLAQASLEVGTYKGKDNYGMDCQLIVKSVGNEYDEPHPLNERAVVSIGIKSYTVSHLPKIDAEKKEITPEAGILTGVAGTSTGAEAIRIKMNHDGDHEGPAEYLLVVQDKDFPGYSETNTCGGLKRAK